MNRVRVTLYIGNVGYIIKYYKRARYKVKKYKTIPQNAVFVPALLQISVPVQPVLTVQRGSEK